MISLGLFCSFYLFNIQSIIKLVELIHFMHATFIYKIYIWLWYRQRKCFHFFFSEVLIFRWSQSVEQVCSTKITLNQFWTKFLRLKIFLPGKLFAKHNWYFDDDTLYILYCIHSYYLMQEKNRLRENKLNQL